MAQKQIFSNFPQTDVEVCSPRPTVNGRMLARQENPAGFLVARGGNKIRHHEYIAKNAYLCNSKTTTISN